MYQHKKLLAKQLNKCMFENGSMGLCWGNNIPVGQMTCKTNLTLRYQLCIHFTPSLLGCCNSCCIACVSKNTHVFNNFTIVLPWNLINIFSYTLTCFDISCLHVYF